VLPLFHVDAAYTPVLSVDAEAPVNIAVPGSVVSE
jgi:hypothetical protein